MKANLIRLNLALLAVIAASVVVVGTVKAAATPCSGDINPIQFNADWGLKPYLVSIGATGWKGKDRLAVPQIAASSPMCPMIATAYQAQQRFYVLLRAFPTNPTKAQWQARYRPLIQSAIAADAAFLTVARGSYYQPRINADKAWLVAAQNAPFGSSPQ